VKISINLKTFLEELFPKTKNEKLTTKCGSLPIPSLQKSFGLWLIWAEFDRQICFKFLGQICSKRNRRTILSSNLFLFKLYLKQQCIKQQTNKSLKQIRYQRHDNIMPMLTIF